MWSGTVIRLRAHTGNYVDIDEQKVHARLTEEEDTKLITVEKSQGGEIKHNDQIFLKAHTGMHLDVEGENVAARLNTHFFIRMILYIRKSRSWCGFLREKCEKIQNFSRER